VGSVSADGRGGRSPRDGRNIPGAGGEDRLLAAGELPGPAARGLFEEVPLT
jgi:hypothetical protein